MFDFSTTPVVWGPNAEAVIAMNAGSPVATLIEVFLLKVMRLAKKQLDPKSDAELIRDMDLFNKQEGQHFKVHASFNQVLREWCPEVGRIEAEAQADYDRFLRDESLRWLVGYCEAFEAIGGLTCVNWIDGFWPEQAGTFESKVVDLFQWHLAEEYEHRTVMWRLYHRLFGEPFAEAHEYRVELFKIASAHFGGYAERLRVALLEQHRVGMSAEQIERSRARETEFLELRNAKIMTQIGPVFDESYDPTHIARPENLDRVLALYPTSRD